MSVKSTLSVRLSLSLLGAVLLFPGLAAAQEPIHQELARDLELTQVTMKKGTQGRVDVELAAAGALEGDAANGGRLELLLSSTVGGRAAYTTFWRLRDLVVLPFLFDEDDGTPLVEVPRGAHTGEARIGIVRSHGLHHGLEAAVYGDVEHGDSEDRMRRTTWLSSDAYYAADLHAEFTPKFRVTDFSPLSFAFPIAYVLEHRGSFTREDAVSSFLGHGISGAIGIRVAEPEWSEGVFEFVGATWKRYGFDRPTGPTKHLETLEIRALNLSKVIFKFPPAMFNLLFKLGAASTLRANDDFTFVGEIGGGVQVEESRFDFVFGRRGVPSPDGQSFLGDSRVEFRFALFEEDQEVGVRLEGVIGLLDRVNSQEDPLFRASALLEVDTEVEDMFRIGAYYRFTRGLDLRDDNWDPWLAAGRQSHELGAAARFVTSFD